MEFPSLVYRCPGEHFAHDGATFKYVSVQSQEEFDAKISDGWHGSLSDAVEHYKNPAPKAAPVVALAPDVQSVKVDEEPLQDNAPPTRGELELKASELGIKFDGRTSDVKLLKMISDKV